MSWNDCPICKRELTVIGNNQFLECDQKPFHKYEVYVNHQLFVIDETFYYCLEEYSSEEGLRAIWRYMFIRDANGLEIFIGNGIQFKLSIETPSKYLLDPKLMEKLFIIS